MALGLFQRRDHLLGLKQQLDLEEVCVFAFPCLHLPVERVLLNVLLCECGANTFCSAMSVLNACPGQCQKTREGPREQLPTHCVSAVLW